jgi:hypothetical protein
LRWVTYFVIIIVQVLIQPFLVALPIVEYFLVVDLRPFLIILLVRYL